MESSDSTSSSTSTTQAAVTEADWAAAKALAEKVRADLVSGADWQEEAAKYSDDPGTKDSGGDLGTISKGEMVPEFEAAVFSLQKDEISKPVRTTYGYHIIQVTGINPAKQYTLDEVKEEITSTLLNEKKLKVWSDWVAKTKLELKVIYRADLAPTTTTTEPASTTTTIPGTPIEPQTGTTASATSTTTATTTQP